MTIPKSNTHKVSAYLSFFSLLVIFFLFIIQFLGTKTGEKFPGSMGPKVQALIDFVERSNKPGVWAAVGDLKDCAKIVAGEEGTFIRRDVKNGVTWRTGKKGPPRKESKNPPPF